MNIPECMQNAINEWFSSSTLCVSESPRKLGRQNASDSVGLDWGPGICILSKFPSSLDAAGSGATF